LDIARAQLTYLLTMWLWPSWAAGQDRPTDAALDILRQRYGRSDITKEEFEEKKQDLS